MTTIKGQPSKKQVLEWRYDDASMSKLLTQSKSIIFERANKKTYKSTKIDKQGDIKRGPKILTKTIIVAMKEWSKRIWGELLYVVGGTDFVYVCGRVWSVCLRKCVAVWEKEKDTYQIKRGRSNNFFFFFLKTH